MIDNARRQFVGGLAAFGASAMLGGARPTSPTSAQTARPHRIDTHHHFFPTDLDEFNAAKLSCISIRRTRRVAAI